MTMSLDDFINDLHQSRAKDNEEKEAKKEDLELLKRKIIRPLEQGKLFLSKLRLGVNSCIALTKGLKKHQLTHLDLSNNMIGDIGCVAIMQLAQMSTSLVYLNVESNEIGDQGSQAIGSMLKDNHSIEVLLLGSSQDALHGNTIGGLGALHILTGLQSNPSIRRLSFNRNPLFANPMGSGGGAAASSSSSSSSSTTQDMQIADQIVAVLDSHPSLNVLELGGTQMTTRAAVTIIKALAKNSWLHMLDISHNTALTFTAFDALARTLEVNTSLTHLVLDGVQLGARGADELATALQQNGTLQHLSLAGCNIEEYGVHAIAQALVKGKGKMSLKHLNVASCLCGPVGCAAVAVYLKNPATALASLVMDNNSIGAGASSLAEALKTFGRELRKKVREKGE